MVSSMNKKDTDDDLRIVIDAKPDKIHEHKIKRTFISRIIDLYDYTTNLFKRK